jgi:hypothetical protein
VLKSFRRRARLEGFGTGNALWSGERGRRMEGGSERRMEGGREVGRRGIFSSSDKATFISQLILCSYVPCIDLFDRL